MKKTFASGCFIFVCFVSFAQKPYNILHAYEDTLKAIAPQILYGKTDEEKYAANNRFLNTLSKALNMAESFHYPFDSLKTIARLYAPDKRFRIINWNIPKADGTPEYFGIIQKPETKKSTSLADNGYIYLRDNSEKITAAENKVLSCENWFGALYYQIVLKKSNGNRYYTLIGWDKNNHLSTKKVIDVLIFPKNKTPEFGAPVFKMDNNNIQNRAIFEYSSQAVISVKYNAEKDMIIFDHLSPFKPSLTGQYEFYGPDGSYDAFKFEKGSWVLLQDVDARNKEAPEDKNYTAPK